MKSQHQRAATATLQPRLRIYRGKEIAFGPGKADLLESVRETGSISLAAKKMGLSYMRAWTLIETMNHCFAEPLVETLRGGNQHGGTQLTALGENVLDLYREMEKNSLKATASGWKRLEKLLR